MAKTADDIKKDLKDSIQQTDRTLDVEQGPIPDIFINPQSGQLANASEDAESLRQLFTLQFDSSITDTEVQNALANYGDSPGGGKPSSHIQYFMRFTKPLTDITIPAGTIVSNAGGDLMYRVLTSGTILAASAPSYYNATRKTYEIGLLVNSIGVGTQYNLPENRINALTTPVTGIDSTENRTKSRGGLGSESRESQIDRLKSELLGVNQGAPGGISSSITNALPEIVTDVVVVQPYEKEFRRNTVKPALDIYCIGNNIQSFEQVYTALGGETQIPLEKVPATSITSLTVNNTSGMTYTLVIDTSPETGYSVASTDYIVLDTSLVTGDVVTIQYNYNQVLNDVHDVVFGGDEYYFNTDMLVRSPFPIYPVLGGTVQTLASYSSTEVEANLRSYLANLFTFTKYTEIVYPDVVRQQVLSNISGIQKFTLTEFRRSTGSLSTIEPMIFSKSEVSVFNANYYKIQVI